MIRLRKIIFKDNGLKGDKNKEKNRESKPDNSFWRGYFKDKHIQRVFIVTVTVILAFLIVLNGATPKRYRLTLGEKSNYDIHAPRDIVNTVKTEENARKAAAEVTPDMKEIRNASIEVINSVVSLKSLIEKAQKDYKASIASIGTSSGDVYKELAQKELEKASAALQESINKLGITLRNAQTEYLISETSIDDISNFEGVLRGLVSDVMKKDITDDNLKDRITELKNGVEDSDLRQELKDVAIAVSNYVLKPNRTINEELTEAKRNAAYNDPKNVEIIKKGQRILSVDDTVTEDKLKVLEDLNLLETKSKFDFALAGGILVVLVLLFLLLILYMNNFCKKVFYNRSHLILMSIVIILTLLAAMAVHEYSTLIIPIFIATMLISILLDLRLALVVNIVLTIAISLMIGSDDKFVYMALITGSFSAFIVSKANQRNKLSFAGTVVAALNVLVITAINIINKSAWDVSLREGIIVFINGIASMLVTNWILPFMESTFNIITPLRLLELANPNQPLLKKLLMEAPGTYHHSLMVGNLAEAGTEAIGGNALLARVGAYFHDIGKLKRPSFFIENQMGDNPHDKMTPNLSALVIISHARDGYEMAKKYKIPLAIRDIILQHHGTTLVAYFYHKAKKCEKMDNVAEANFRYDGVKPASREAAVVMLADSVEAAVRSMTDKTEGKIEGLIRKIIKDKLDDGQLDHCSLTLKDLDTIAKAFVKTFGGFFHEREEYPALKDTANRLKSNDSEDYNEAVEKTVSEKQEIKGEK
ncbi:MAG TPA: HDIG domain-containing protein [Acetivibrio sp.]|nr:HDIG domain-containing protein [Acetivibrio sp.]